MLLVDTNDKLASVIAQLLADEDGITVAGVTRDAATALRLCRQVRPDVILLDGKLAGTTAVSMCAALRAASDAAVLLWLSEPDAAASQSPYVDGLLPRGMTFRELVRVIKRTRPARTARPALG